MNIETVITTAIIGLLAAYIIGMIACDIYHEKVEMPESYRAWVKQTGNPKSLTFDEWRALVRATEHHDDTTFVPIYMPISH